MFKMMDKKISTILCSFFCFSETMIWAPTRENLSLTQSDRFSYDKAYTLNKSSNWSSLEIGHPLCLIFVKSMKDMTLKFCIYNRMTLIIRLPYYSLKYCF